MNAVMTADNLRTEQDSFVNAIIDSNGANLPATIDEILPILIFSKAKVNAWRSLVDSTRKIPEQEDLNAHALASGQRWGIAHLYGQKRLGELTREIPKNKPGGAIDGKKGGSAPTVGLVSKRQALINVGLTENISSDAERIAANPEILEQEIADAENRGDIPTKSGVLKRIKKMNYQEKHPPTATERPDISEVALTVSNRLADCYAKLIKLWDEKEYIPDSLQDSIIDTIEKLHTLTGE